MIDWKESTQLLTYETQRHALQIKNDIYKMDCMPCNYHAYCYYYETENENNMHMNVLGFGWQQSIQDTTQNDVVISSDDTAEGTRDSFHQVHVITARAHCFR